MRRSLVPVALALVTLLALAKAPVRAQANDVPDCVEVRAEARQNGIGFMHVVMVTNRCTYPVACDLATSADPSPTQALRVEPNQSGEVVTRVASPAGGIQAIATCRQTSPRPAPPRRVF